MSKRVLIISNLGLSNGKGVSKFGQTEKGFARRERFNSDPNEKYLGKYTSSEEVNIDPKLVSYTLKSKWEKFIIAILSCINLIENIFSTF